LEGLLAGTENVESVRSTSSQGLSAIQVVFGRGGDPYRQRQVVTERLAESGGLLPAGAGPPLLSPLSSSMEYLVHFGYTSERLSPIELRDLVRWMIKPQILAVPGVAQAQIFGGASRERQVLVDPHKLLGAGLTLEDLYGAARHATELIGGGYIETPTQRIVLQAQPAGATPAALSQAVIAVRNGAALRIGDVATVRDTAEPSFGDAMIGGRPGILVETSTQYGANTLEVTTALEERLNALVPALALQGVQYHPALLRPASFIETAIAKLRNSLLTGAVLVVLLLLVTLRDWRAALVSFSSIPIALLATVWILAGFGISLNTMTLGGLVVALGVVVDDAVIDVENIMRRRRMAAHGVDIRQRIARSEKAGVLRDRCGRGRVSADSHALGPARLVLPSTVDCVSACRWTLVAGGHERNPGAVRARHGRACAARGSRMAHAPEAHAEARDRAALSKARARIGDPHRHRRRRHCSPAVSGRPALAGLPRGLFDRARILASRHCARRNGAPRQAHRGEAVGHYGRQECCRTDRPCRERPGSGCA
jgi:hypothetical protein